MKAVVNGINNEKVLDFKNFIDDINGFYFMFEQKSLKQIIIDFCESKDTFIKKQKLSTLRKVLFLSKHNKNILMVF